MGIYALAFALLLSPAVAHAGDPSALLARVEKSAQSVKTLAGEFTQKSRIKLFKQELTSRGRFSYRRPREIRWEYLSPDPSVLVLDGDRAVLAAPGAPPQTFDLTRDATMRAIFDQITLWLGAASAASLKEGYDVTAAGSDDAPALLLQPKPGGAVAKAFSRIELRFDKQLLLHAILLRESSGDEKEAEGTRLAGCSESRPGISLIRS